MRQLVEEEGFLKSNKLLGEGSAAPNSTAEQGNGLLARLIGRKQGVVQRGDSQYSIKQEKSSEFVDIALLEKIDFSVNNPARIVLLQVDDDLVPLVDKGLHGLVGHGKYAKIVTADIG